MKLLVAWCAVNNWTYEQIVATYRVLEREKSDLSIFGGVIGTMHHLYFSGEPAVA